MPAPTHASCVLLASYSTSLCLTFLSLYKGIVLLTMSWRCRENERRQSRRETDRRAGQPREGSNMVAAMAISSRGPLQGSEPKLCIYTNVCPPPTDSTVRLPVAPTFLALIQFNKHRISIVHQAEDAGEDVSGKGRS